MMINQINYNDDMPTGLKMALTQNLDSLNKFASLPESRQQSFIQGAHSIRSKQQMHEYVNTLLQG